MKPEPEVQRHSECLYLGYFVLGRLEELKLSGCKARQVVVPPSYLDLSCYEWRRSFGRRLPDNQARMAASDPFFFEECETDERSEFSCVLNTNSMPIREEDSQERSCWYETASLAAIIQDKI